MFAPPPVQLSRAEVEARLAAKRKNAGNEGSLRKNANSTADPNLTSLHRDDSRSSVSPRRTRVFNTGRKSKVSTSHSASTQSSPTPKQRSGVFNSTAGEIVESPTLPNGFAEHPRPAPVPPKRSTRPPSEWFEPRLPRAAAPRVTIPEVAKEIEAPPPIPEKSPKRQKTDGQPQSPQLPKQQPISRELSLNTGLSHLQLHEGVLNEGPFHLPRSFTAPAESVRNDGIVMAKPDHTMTVNARTIHDRDFRSMNGSRVGASSSGVKGAKVDKTATKRISTVSTIRATLLDFDELKFFTAPKAPPRRATESEILTTKPITPPEIQMPRKRRRKGETMSMLLETGFFPAENLAYNEDNPNVNVKAKLSPPLSLLNKELPDTPTSIMPTPTEMYQCVPPRPTRTVVRGRKVGGGKRVPLGQLATTHAKANGPSTTRDLEEVSPSRLSAIPENTPISPVSENSPIPSGINTPVATQIHLRGGSVVTVSPPELTAWQKSIYVQGPIKLPKPVIVPRKNSVASLEPFQEAIDQVYQEALNIPRRRSDDAVVDDVCEFFDDFGFEEIAFEGDSLGVEGVHVDELHEDDLDAIKRYGTPPAEFPSPVEKVLAKEIVETLAKPDPVPKPPIPPIENEATLRAKDIAHLLHTAATHATTIQSGRKDSGTLSRPETGVLPLLPLPEESMLEAVLEPISTEKDDVIMDDQADQGFDWDDDDVEELDSTSSWLAPRVLPRRLGLHKGYSRSHTMRHRKKQMR